jgi:putative cell wall-binding protein
MNTIVRKQSTSLSTDVNEIISKITFSWKKATEYIMEVAILLNQYQTDKEHQKLWFELRTELIERKIMSKTTISNLCSIGNNQLLQKNMELLPPAYNTISELSRLSDDDLSDKFKTGLITTDLKLEDVRSWKSFKDIVDVDVIEKHKDKPDKIKSITISFTENQIIRSHDKIDSQLSQLKKMFRGADIEVSGLLKRKIDGD